MKHRYTFRKCIIALLLSCCFSLLHGQTYPTFSVTAYDTTSEGYYFCAPSQKFPTAFTNQMILDDKGRVVYTKYIQGMAANDFKIQPNGLMSYAGSFNSFYLMDSTFTIVDSVSCVNGIFTDLHDLQILPNGHFLMLGYEFITMNLSSYHYFNHNGSPGSHTAHVRCGVIQELDANRNLVFEWHTKDHFAFNEVDQFFLAGPVNVDFTHCNAVELDDDGNILLSSRHLDEITKINRSDSSVIWRLGGNANQFTFTNNPSMFIGQHDIRRITNGNITLNDNGRATVHPASAKEYQLDENLMTATLAWSYTEDSASASMSMGNCQRLANGNTVVDNGDTPDEQHAFNVVDSLGHKIFEITFDDSAHTYRAFNYPNLPWALHRPQITCFTSGSQLYLDAGSGYSSYLWSNGATTQTIPVNNPDTFSVFVPYGQGGFISSEYLYISDPATYCSPLGEPTIPENEFSINPNPASNELTIEFPSQENKHTLIEVYDCVGKIILTSATENPQQKISLDISGLPAGIYFVKINGAARKFVKI